MTDDRLKPLLIVKPKTVSRTDIRRCEKQAGIVIIECSDPEAVRYSEPPIDAQLDVQARAALSLLRMILANSTPDFKRGDLTRFYVDALLNGGVPARVPSPAPVKK